MTAWTELLATARKLPHFQDSPVGPADLDRLLAEAPYPDDFVAFARSGFAGVSLGLTAIALRPLPALRQEAGGHYRAVESVGCALVGLDGGGNGLVWDPEANRLGRLWHGNGGDGLELRDGTWCDEDGEPVDLRAELQAVDIHYFDPTPGAPPKPLRPHATAHSFAQLIELCLEHALWQRSLR